MDTGHHCCDAPPAGEILFKRFYYYAVSTSHVQLKHIRSKMFKPKLPAKTNVKCKHFICFTKSCAINRQDSVHGPIRTFYIKKPANKMSAKLCVVASYMSGLRSVQTERCNMRRNSPCVRTAWRTKCTVDFLRKEKKQNRPYDYRPPFLQTPMAGKL